MAKYYLDPDGVRILVRNFNNSLDQKMDKFDLNEYASKDYVENIVDNLEISADTSEIERKIAQLEGSVNGIYHYKGSVDNREALGNIANPAIGDVYNIADSGMNVAWTEEGWDDFGSTMDLSEYLKDEEVQSISFQELNDIFAGRSVVISSIDDFTTMLSNNENEVIVMLADDLALTSTLSIENKKVVLDLGGNTLSGTTILNIADGGEVTLKNGNINSTSAAINVAANGKLILDGATITSKNNGINVKGDNAIAIVESGEITSQEAGIAGFKNSTVIINGGTITGLDNGPIMGNGSVGDTANNGENVNITMNGGKLIAHIQSSGYIACGVYLPNSGTFTMNGGEIESDGAGIVMRGGTVNLNGGKITATGTSGVLGKVGDSQITVGPYAVVYEAKSRYPHYETLELNIAKNMELNGTDGAIAQVLEDGITANIHDNR